MTSLPPVDSYLYRNQRKTIDGQSSLLGLDPCDEKRKRCLSQSGRVNDESTWFWLKNELTWNNLVKIPVCIKWCNDWTCKNAGVKISWTTINWNKDYDRMSMKPWFQASNQRTWEGLVEKSSTALEITSVKTASNWWKRYILKTLGHVMKKQENYYIRFKQEQQSSHCFIDWCSVMFFLVEDTCRINTFSPSSTGRLSDWYFSSQLRLLAIKRNDDERNPQKRTEKTCMRGEGCCYTKQVLFFFLEKKCKYSLSLSDL